jgi:hypothetical protein
VASRRWHASGASDQAHGAEGDGRMKRDFEKRLGALETVAGNKIETLADFVLWHAKGRKDRTELSPKLENVLSEFLSKK